jgi:ferrous iron transport protein A
MKPGETSTIIKVHGEGAIKKRILDMGLTKGATVVFIKKAPLGDPLEIKVRSYGLSLRIKEASVIEVE